MMLTASAGRLHLLDSLCRSWPFPMAVAVYAPVIVSSNSSDALEVDRQDAMAEAAVQKAAVAVQAAFDRYVWHDCQGDCMLFHAAALHRWYLWPTNEGALTHIL